MDDPIEMRDDLDMRFLIPCCSFLALIFPLGADEAAGPQSGSPNVLLILTDDMGWMDLACQGNDKLHTPNIDALAAQGVRFTDAYAASPVCSPTRASLMTGLAPARLNITQHGADNKAFWPKDRKVTPPEIEHILPLEQTTLPEHLKEKGYATGFFGKWHLSGTRGRRMTPAQEVQHSILINTVSILMWEDVEKEGRRPTSILTRFLHSLLVKKGNISVTDSLMRR